MKVNFKRILSAAAALLIIGLVIVVYLQYTQIERFMNLDKDIELTGATTKEIPNISPAECETQCKSNPACIAAIVKKNGKGCLLKSTIGSEITSYSMSALRFPCELYNDVDFTGKGMGLDVGKYYLTDLKTKGYTDKSLRSIKMRDGYKITIYDKDAFGGNYVSFTTSQPDLDVIIRDPRVEPNIKWTNAVSSVMIERI